MAASLVLTSSSVFCRTDTSTDSKQFYESVLDFLDHPDERNEVHDLLNWWNWWVLVACSWIPLNWYFFNSWQPIVPELCHSRAHHYRDQCASQAEGKEGRRPDLVNNNFFMYLQVVYTALQFTGPIYLFDYFYSDNGNNNRSIVRSPMLADHSDLPGRTVHHSQTSCSMSFIAILPVLHLPW